MWDTIEQVGSGTVARAERLPEPARHERVDDEPMPYHRLGMTHSSYPPKDAAALGIDLNTHPSFVEVMEASVDRMARVRTIVDGLSDVDLERMCRRAPAPGYPEELRTVGRCLRVVMKEE